MWKICANSGVREIRRGIHRVVAVRPRVAKVNPQVVHFYWRSPGDAWSFGSTRTMTRCGSHNTEQTMRCWIDYRPSNLSQMSNASVSYRVDQKCSSLDISEDFGGAIFSLRKKLNERIPLSSRVLIPPCILHRKDPRSPPKRQLSVRTRCDLQEPDCGRHLRPLCWPRSPATAKGGETA
jgi:hypothetical protein